MCSAQHAASDDSGDDDVWADGSDEQEGGQGELQREGATRQQQFYNSGYRDGMEAGKEKTLQAGFDIGFKQGVQAGYEWGSLKAVVKSLRIVCGQVPGSSQWESKIEALSSKVEGVKDREAMLGALQQLLLVPLEDADMPEQEHADVELLQAFSTAKQSQARGVETAAGLPDMPRMVADVRSSLASMGFQQP